MANGGDINYIINVNGSSAVRNIENVTNSFNRLQNVSASSFERLQNVGAKLAGIGAGLSIAITKPILDFIKTGIEFNSSIEQAQTTFETLTGSVEDATSKVNYFRKMAASTPFEMSDLMNSAKTMLAFGVETEKVIPNVEMLGDVAMGNRERFKSLSLAFSQIQATGRLMGQDLLQLVNAGFNPLQVISQKTGISLVDLKKKMEKGGISADTVTKAFQIATSEGGRFFKAMESSSKTYEGQMSTISDAAKTALGAIMKPLFDTLTSTILPNLITKINELRTWFESLPASIQKTILAVTLITAAIPPLLAVMGGAILLFTTISGAISSISWPIIAVVTAIGGLGAALISFWNTNEQFRNGVSTVWNTIATVIEYAVVKIMTAWQTYGSIIIESAMLTWNTILELISPVFSMIYEIVLNSVSQMILIWDELMDSFASISELFSTMKPIFVALGVILYTLLGIFISLVAGILNAVVPAVNLLLSLFSALTYAVSAVADVINGNFVGALNNLDMHIRKVSDSGNYLFQTLGSFGEGMFGAAAKYGQSSVSAYEKMANGISNIKSEMEDIGKPKLGVSSLSSMLQQGAAPSFNMPKVDLSGIKKVEKTTQKIGNTSKVAKIEFGKLGDEIQKKGKSAADNFADSMKKVTDEIVQQTRSFSNFVGLFDKVERKGTGSGVSLMNRLRKQVEEEQKWASGLSIIEEKLGGMSPDLMNALRKEGPGAARQIIGLSQLDESQLKEYAGLYGQKQAISWQEAKKVVQYEHSGTITVSGVDTKGETVEISKIIARDIASEKDRYSNNQSAAKLVK